MVETREQVGILAEHKQVIDIVGQGLPGRGSCKGSHPKIGTEVGHMRILNTMIHRPSAIEPVTGLMKMD